MQEWGYPGVKKQGDQEGGVGEKMGNEAWHEREMRGILQNVWSAGVGGMGAGWVSNLQNPPPPP